MKGESTSTTGQPFCTELDLRKPALSNNVLRRVSLVCDTFVVLDCWINSRIPSKIPRRLPSPRVFGCSRQVWSRAHSWCAEPMLQWSTNCLQKPKHPDTFSCLTAETCLLGLQLWAGGWLFFPLSSLGPRSPARTFGIPTSFSELKTGIIKGLISGLGRTY